MELTDKEYDLIVFCIQKHLTYFEDEDRSLASHILSKIRKTRES